MQLLRSPLRPGLRPAPPPGAVAPAATRRPGQGLAWRATLARAADRVADWAAAERGRMALWLPLFMAAGAGLYLLLPFEPAWWAGAAAGAAAACMLAACMLAACMLAAGMLAAGAVAAWGRAAVRAVAAMLLAGALGFASGQAALWRAPPVMQVPRRAVQVAGIVAQAERLAQGWRVTLAAASLTTADGSAPPAARTVRIRLRRDDPAAPAAGDTLAVRALLSPPSPPAYPGAWDLQRDAFFGGVGAYGFALGRAALSPGPPPRGPAAWLEQARETVASRIGAALPGPEAAVATTLLTGDAASVSAADHAAFRDSGLAHLLAIAGLHIGIVMGLAFGATRLALAAWERAALHWPIKAIAALAALAAGGLYMLLTGAHVPIMRSFAMAALFTVAVLAGRRALSLRGWALAMAAIVLLQPDAVLGVSFQMSFAAVLALIAGYEALRPLLHRLRGQGGAGRLLAGWVLALALTSALAGTASAPFGAYHFGRVQAYYVLANMAAVPLTALWVMPLGLLSLALMPLHLEALALLPMAWGIDAVLWVGRNVAGLPQATLAVPPIPGWGLGVLALGMAWLGLWRTRLRLAGVPMLAVGLASPLLAPPPDVLVSADARLIGLHVAGQALVQATRGAQQFERDAWSAYWGAGPAEALPESGAAGPVLCDAAACRWRAAGGAVLLARQPPDAAACAAALVLSAAPVRLRCPSPVPVIDRFSVWREGAFAVWLRPGGARLLSDHAVRGVRPWVPVPGHAQSIAGLPLAPAETLPPP